MRAETFIILILAHFVSDWFFQPTYWGDNKSKNKKYLTYHSIQYAIIFLPVFYFLGINYLWAIYLFVAHFIIDTRIPINLWNDHVRNAISKKKIPKGHPDFFIKVVEDQILHILLLIPIIVS